MSAQTAVADNALDSPTRLKVLGDTGLMGSAPEEDFDRLTRLASTLFRARMALVSLIGDRQQFSKSAVGLPVTGEVGRHNPLDQSYCKHVVTRAAPLIIEDACTHPLVRGYRDMHGVARAYAGMPLRLSSGLVVGSFCVVDDRPRRWQAHEVAALRDLAASVTTEIELRLMLAAQEDIMAIVSHDLKSPLSGIGLNCEVLEAGMARQAGSLPPLWGRSVGRIRRSCDRMTEMVHELLDQARRNHGRVVLRMQQHCALSVAQRAVDSVQSLAEERGVALVVGDRLHAVTVTCDAARTSQMLTNLLSNAITYTGERSCVRLDAVEADAWVRITVQDQGPGLSREAQERVFAPFSRESDEDPQRHHGYGLHGASKLAAAQGHRLGVESEEGRGATFYIEMPKRPWTPAS